MPDRLTPVVERVRRSTEEVAQLLPGARVVVGVSGGQDSVALLHLLHAARPDLELIVAHVRHGLRDDAGDSTAAADNAVGLDLDFVECRVQVGEGRGPEDAARSARWAALAEVAAERDAVAVAVGHTMDDQAETVLLRIARGTGIPGLAGMAPVGPIPAPRRSLVVVRPLLGERRDVIRLAAVGHPTVEDPTNDDADQRRARARHEALPALTRLHPSEGDVVPLLARLADFARTTSQAAPSSTTSHAPQRVAATRFGAAVDITTHGDQPLHRCEDGLHRAWSLLDRAPPWPGGRLVGLLADLPVGASTDLPGAVRMTRVRLREHGVTDRVVLCPIHRGPRPVVTLRAGEETSLPGFGTVRWTEAADGAVEVATDHARWRAWAWTVTLPLAGDSLAVRRRGPDGDRAARRVLQRIARPLREEVPLLVDSTDQIVMAGHRILPVRSRSSRLVTVVAKPTETTGGGRDSATGVTLPANG